MSRPRRSRQVERLPEDPARVAAFDAKLKRNKSQVLEQLAAHRQRWARQKVTTLTGVGWPLRPLFLEARTVDFVAGALHRGFARLQAKLVRHARSFAYLARKLPIDPRMYRCLDFARGVSSDSWLAVLRPDGFLFRDRYVMTEVNFGNGTIVSNAYSEALYDFFAGSPVFRALEWDVEAGLRRPFLGYLEMIRRYARVPPGGRRPFVALLAHSFEHQVILDYPPRVIQQIYFAQRALAAAGIDTRIVHEDEVWVDEGGRARVRGSRREVDLVLQITIGTSFVDEPERLRGDLKVLRGAKVGRARLVKPIAAVCMDKGTIPFLAELPGWPARGPGGFRVELARTEYPTPSRAPSYRLRKDEWVLKKSFDGKDTLVGVSAAGREWNRLLDQAVGSKEYVIQEYHSMPLTRMPVAIDERHIEWLPVRVELSPFIFEGRFHGAIARYAPDAEGLILSPPPEDMGLTTVFVS